LAEIKTVDGSQEVVKLSGNFPLSTMDFKVNTMTTATDTDLQQVKDLITAGNATTQKQVADLALSTQKQISDTQKQIADLAASTQKQIADLTATTQKQFADLTQRVEVGFAEVKGDIRELRSELKALDTKFDEKTKSLDQRITGKEFTIRGVTVAILSGLLLAFGKFLFFGKI
jgi:predicted  nucleic acid-binding Zn-ribbon protein